MLNDEVRLSRVSGAFNCVVCALLLFVSACVASGGNGHAAGQVEGVTGRELEPAGPLVPLSFQVSGGFAGRSEVLDITTDGLVTWTDIRRPTRHSEQLAPQVIVKLQTLLTEALAGEDNGGGFPFPGRCRDCLVYRLTLKGNSKSRTLVVQSDRLNSSAHRELISMLLALGDKDKRETP